MTNVKKFHKAFSGKATIPYIMAGDPNLSASKDLICALDSAGADIIEVGVPFSDPLADGPVIQAAGIRSLQNGAKLDKVLSMLRFIKDEIRAPIVIMSYANPICRYGLERFSEDAYNAGVSGVIIPDVPFDESGYYADKLENAGVDFIFMAAPNTSDSRLAEISARSKAFLYCVSILGVTGSSDKLASASSFDSNGENDHPNRNIRRYLERVRKISSVPIVLGFGIDGPEKAGQFAPYSDGVVVGSALVKIIEKYGSDPKKTVEESVKFLQGIKRAVDALKFQESGV